MKAKSNVREVDAFVRQTGRSGTCYSRGGRTLTESERRAKAHARGEGVRTHAAVTANRVRDRAHPRASGPAPRSPSPHNRCPILH